MTGRAAVIKDGMATDDHKKFEGRVEHFDLTKPFFMIRFHDGEASHQARIPTRWLTGDAVQSVCAAVGSDGLRHVFRKTGGTETTCGERTQHPQGIDGGALCSKCFVVS